MLAQIVVFLAGFILGAFVLVTVALLYIFSSTDNDHDDEEQDSWLS